MFDNIFAMLLAFLLIKIEACRGQEEAPSACLFFVAPPPSKKVEGPLGSSQGLGF